MVTHLHIVSFNVPSPANYGGVIDVMGRIVELHKRGVKIHLHCFLYNRPPDDSLLNYCVEVCYYKRNTSFLSHLSARPYIVRSRHSESLLSRLRLDKYPVLIEGLHCCHVLEHLHGRQLFVRMHNVEHDYYNGLAGVENKWWKRLFYRIEASKLKRYEPVLSKATAVWAISQKDFSYFRSKGYCDVRYMPSVAPHCGLMFQPQKGDYVLYHANLSVPENIHAAEFIIKNIAPYINYEIVIAGANPDKRLALLASTQPNVSLRPNPSDVEMDKLVSDAQVIVLYTKQATGLKLKLLKSVSMGRHCVVNSAMVEGTSLGEFCQVADTPDQMVAFIDKLMLTPFTLDDFERRKCYFESLESPSRYFDEFVALLQ